MARFPGIYDNSRYGANIADLLARQGEIAARGAEQSGAIWSQAINQLGQIGAGAVQEHQARKESEKRKLAFDQAVSGWDGKDPMSLYRAIAPHVGPDDAARFAAGMSQLIKVNQGEKPTPEGLKTVVKALKASRKVYGDEGMAERWPQAAQALQPFAPLLPGPIPQEYTPQVGDYIDAFDAEMSPPKAETGFSLSPGQVRYDASGKQVAAGPPIPPKVEATPKAGSFEAFVAANPGADVLKLRAQWEAAGRAPKEAPPPPAERVFNPEGVVLSSYGIKEKEDVRREARGRGLPVFENVTAQAKGVTLAGIVADAEELTGLLKLPEVQAAIGPAAGRWNQLKGKLVDLDPNVQRALALANSLSDTELRKRSGAQINEKEMQRLLKFTTDPNRPLSHNVVMAAGLLKSAARDYRALSGLDLVEGAGLPEPESAPAGAKRGTGSFKDPYVFE